MKPLNLAPLTPFGSPPIRHTNSTNPGCFDPASQSFAPAPTDQAGSRSKCASPTATSNGEMQHGNQHLGTAFNGTVQVSAGSGAVVQAQGEGGQLLDQKKAVLAVPTGKGLPPTIDVSASSQQLGGLPTNINIR